MFQTPPEWKTVARVRKSCFRHSGFLVNEAEAFEFSPVGPDGFVAHEGELGNGEPISRGDVGAGGESVGVHYGARRGDCVGWGVSLNCSDVIIPFTKSEGE